MFLLCWVWGSLCVALYRLGCVRTHWRAGSYTWSQLQGTRNSPASVCFPLPGRFLRLQPVLIISLRIRSPMLTGQRLIKGRWTKCLGNESLFREIRHTWEDAIKEGSCLQPHVLIYLPGRWHLYYGANNPSSECSSRPAQRTLNVSPQKDRKGIMAEFSKLLVPGC